MEESGFQEVLGLEEWVDLVFEMVLGVGYGGRGGEGFPQTDESPLEAGVELQWGDLGGKRSVRVVAVGLGR